MLRGVLRLSQGKVMDAMGGQLEKQLQILLVEDHADTARMMQRILSAFGHDVRTADSVASALNIAQTQPIDVLIADIGLPDGTGLDIMRQLAAANRRIPGIVLSGYDMQEDVQNSLKAGFAEHLTKPIDVAQLDAAIKRVAATRRVG
jgi:CheY-like chemotaxis protein